MNNKLHILKAIQVINLLLFLAVIGLIAEHATHKSMQQKSALEKSSNVQQIKS